MEMKVCEMCKKDFVVEQADFDFYAKLQVLTPKFCPLCRQERRMLFRNFKTLYKRPSSKSGKQIVSMYASDSPFPVYEATEWWGDDWDALTYGRDIDWSRPFLEQFGELLNAVPRMALINTKSTNCEYSNMVYGSNNCYLLFGSINDENCDYGHIVWDSRDSIDNLYVLKCERCYECIDCQNCNSLLYSQECESCSDSIGLYDCRGCTNCIGCVGLRQKSYHIFNQPVSKEEYKQFLVEHPLSGPKTVQLILSEREKLRLTHPHPELFSSRVHDVSGNHIYNAHNVHHSFDVRNGENAKFIFTSRKAVESYDVSFSVLAEQSYELLTCAGNNLLACHWASDSSYISYSDSCFGSNNLFGCAGLRQKSYCILNKQYTKEEYEVLVQKIIEGMKAQGDYGEFFPKEMSQFAYNESIANEYTPRTKAEALSLGYRWRDDIPHTAGQETISNDELPKNPEAYDSSLLKHVLKCDDCGKNYRFIDREITFYKMLGLLLPRSCFNCRHARRMNLRNKRQLFPGSCQKCGTTIATSFSCKQQKEYKVYCTSCYQQEVA
jgi:hypothetical protein